MKLVHSYTDMDRVEKAGLLHIPQTVKEANQPLPSTGIVVQLGVDFRFDLGLDLGLEQGSMVMFSRFAGTDFRIDEEQFRILDENEIMCTLIDTQGVVAPVVEE